MPYVKYLARTGKAVSSYNFLASASKIARVAVVLLSYSPSISEDVRTGGEERKVSLSGFS